MGSCEEGEPDTVWGQATVQVCRVRCLVDVESFCDPSMGEVWYDFLHFGRLPLHLVSRIPSVHSNAILVVTLLHCRFVFSEPFPLLYLLLILESSRLGVGYVQFPLLTAPLLWQGPMHFHYCYSRNINAVAQHKCESLSLYCTSMLIVCEQQVTGMRHAAVKTLLK